MPRRLHLAAFVLSVLTAAALLGAAAAVRPPGPPAVADAPREAANRALAYAFYGAANEAIATGDLAPLQAVVAPGYTDRDTEDGAASGRERLADRLLDLHRHAPDLLLAVEAVASDGDLVIAHVRAIGGTRAAFLGLQLDEEWTSWPPVDVFRVEQGRIVERQGPAADTRLLTPALEATLALPPPEKRTLAVTRTTLAPGAHHAAPAGSGPRLLLAEAGTIAIEPVAPDAAAALPVTLSAGAHHLLPPGSGYAARSTGHDPAALLDIAFEAPAPTWSASWAASPPTVATPALGAVVDVEALAEDLLVDVPSRQVVLTVGRVTLELGEGLGWSAAEGPVLLHVEAGAVDVAATGSVPWVRAGSDERSTGGVEATLVANGGALLDAGAAVELRAAPAVPATVLVLTILPIGEPTTANNAATGRQTP